MKWDYSNRLHQNRRGEVVRKRELCITLTDFNGITYVIRENKFLYCKPLYYADIHMKNGRIVSVHTGTQPRKARLNIFFPNEIADIITEYAALIPIFKK